MTIRVTVKNEDERDASKIRVDVLNGTAPVVVESQELKAGESAEFWVHSNQSLTVSEK